MARVRGKTMRIAIDIDSTLHHYWDLLSDSARRRFGIELPYEEQLTWGVTRLRPEQLDLCIAETHNDAQIAAGRPYPNAVEAVGRWHDAGHFIHITSHRASRAHAATERWLADIGLRFDELYCSFDKVARCREIGIDMLIDDSPVNLARALEHDIRAVTLLHPWNRDLCEEEDVLCAEDWFELERKLAPLLGTVAPGDDGRREARSDNGSQQQERVDGAGADGQEPGDAERGERSRSPRRGRRVALRRVRAAVRRDSA